MPNWCDNKISVLGSKEDVDAFVKKANGLVQHYQPYDDEPADEETIVPFSFHQLVPIPDHIMAQKYDPAGYSAERELWGVKWGSTDSVLEKHVDGRADYSFKTPWSSARRFLLIASKDWPALIFMGSFSEESPSRGKYIIKNGVEAINVYEQYDKTKWPQHLENATDKEENDWYRDRYQPYTDFYVNNHDAWVSGSGHLIAAFSNMFMEQDNG